MALLLIALCCWLLQVVTGVIALVCFILVLIKMFQNDESTMAWVCIVTTPCGMGPVMVLIYGWSMAGQWDIRNTMIAWTVAMVVGLIVGIAAMMLAG